MSISQQQWTGATNKNNRRRRKPKDKKDEDATGIPTSSELLHMIPPVTVDNLTEIATMEGKQGKIIVSMFMSIQATLNEIKKDADVARRDKHKIVNKMKQLHQTQKDEAMTIQK